MRILLLLSLVYISAVVQTSLAEGMRVGSVTPDLLALVAVIWLLVANGPRAFLVAGAVVLIGDLISPGRVGLGMAWMLPLGYGVTRMRMRLKWDHLAWHVLTLWVVVTVWAAALGVSSRLLGDVALPWSTVLQRAAGVGLYTAGVGLPVLMIVGWIRQPLLRREEILTQP